MNNLILNITDLCSNKCIMCHVRHHHRGVCQINIDTIESIFKEASEIGFSQIIVAGGEPLLHPEIREVLHIAHKNNLVVNLFTSGILSERHIVFFKKYPPQILTLSIDAPIARIHNLIRKNPHSFKRVKNTIDYIKKYDIKTQITALSVVLRENLRSLLEFPDYYRSVGIDNYGLTLPMNDFMIKNRSILDKEGIIKLYFYILPEMIRRSLRYRQRITIYPIFYQIIPHINDYEYLLRELHLSKIKEYSEEIELFSKGIYNKIKLTYSGCRIKGRDLLIDSDLSIYPCSQITIVSRENRLGEFGEIDLKEAIRRAQAFKSKSRSCLYCISFANEGLVS